MAKIDEVQELSITMLRPYQNNPRFNDEAAEYVAKSIKEFGFRNPILVTPDYEIISGHARYKAAILLGLSTVPCIVVHDMSEDEIRAFRIADNKTAERADWNFDMLDIEVDDLEQGDFQCGEFDVEKSTDGIALGDFDLGAYGDYKVTIKTDNIADIAKAKEIAEKYGASEVETYGHRA